MARLAARTSGAGHASETVGAASLPAPSAAKSVEGNAADFGSNRRPVINEHTLREHFHLPLHTVALKFGMCTTAFKKMCRRMGIAKWPHRQVRLRPPHTRILGSTKSVCRSTESVGRQVFFLDPGRDARRDPVK